MPIYQNSYPTVDDLLNDVFEHLLKETTSVKASRGTFTELIGQSFILTNPLARLSRTEKKGTPFSALGELLWYLSGSNDLGFIEYYLPKYKKDSDDDLTVHGGYGPRLFNMRGEINQIENVLKLLKKKQSSRRAVIQLFDASDITADFKEIPCTCSIQFLIRDQKLNMYVSMRSNDAYWGLPHDIFSFTMLQEIIARTLGVDLGQYYHSVGSLHLYDDQRSNAQQYLDEGFQSTTIAMPPMPPGDPFENLEIVKIQEKLIRTMETTVIDYSRCGEKYWCDLIRLLSIHKLLKNNKAQDIENVKKEIDQRYITYIDKRLSTLQKYEK